MPKSCINRFFSTPFREINFEFRGGGRISKNFFYFKSYLIDK